MLEFLSNEKAVSSLMALIIVSSMMGTFLIVTIAMIVAGYKENEEDE